MGKVFAIFVVKPFFIFHNLGGPVLIIPWGKIAARAVYKSLGEDEIIKSAIRLIENRPEPTIQFSALIDCDDVCLRQVNI